MSHLKFRIYNSKTKAFLDLEKCSREEYHLSANGSIFYYYNDGSGGYDCDYLDETDGYFIDMFTGLQDIKKVDIYAGDILRVGENLIGDVRWIDKNDEEYGDEIHAAFHFHVKSQNKLIPFDEYLLSNCTVIGNIHENPELI